MEDDLFGLSVEVNADCFSSVFASGASSYWDARGTIEAGRPIGVVAGEMPPSTVELVRTYASSGGAVFVDSGAFSAFRKGETVDFEAVFSVYDKLLNGLPPSARQMMFLVMPDVVGDQEATMALLGRYRERIIDYIESGAEVIVSLQKGATPVHQVAECLKTLLGCRLRFGLPSNAAALPDEELAKIRHDRFHILGKATLDAKLKRRAYTLLEANPGANLTCDANLIRSRMDKVTQAHQEMLKDEQDPFAAIFDDTELIYAVLHDREWLKRSEIARLAGLYGVSALTDIRQWIEAHKQGELAVLIEEHDPECSFLYAMLPQLFTDVARKNLSARLRSKAVALALAA